MNTARRRNGGKDLHDAMWAAGMTQRELARATKKADPTGMGISIQLIAFLATRRSWGRETTSLRSAALIEQALGAEPWTLFEEVKADAVD